MGSCNTIKSKWKWKCYFWQIEFTVVVGSYRLVIHVPALEISVQRTELSLGRGREVLWDSIVRPGLVAVNGGVDLALRAVDNFIVCPVGCSGHAHLRTGNPAGVGAWKPTELRTFRDCPRSGRRLGSRPCRWSRDCC